MSDPYAGGPRLKFALLLTLGGLLVLAVSVLTALFGGVVLGDILHPVLSPGVPGTNVQGGELGNTFYLAFSGFSAITAILFAYITWNKRARSWRRAILYGLSLAILLLLSGMNFSNHDTLLPRSGQALLNIVMMLMSSVVVLDLQKLSVATSEGRVLRAAAVAGLVFLGICLPGLFTFLWALNRLGVDLQGIGLGPLLAAISGLVGAVVGILNYRLKVLELKGVKSGSSQRAAHLGRDQAETADLGRAQQRSCQDFGQKN